MASRTWRSVAGATSTVALIAGGIVAVSFAAPAQAAPGDDPCPAAYPLTQTVGGSTVSNLTAGQPVTGLTSVDSGPPVEFTGEYVGTIDNGIADGLDMLVFDLEGPRITNADGTVDAGNWAGISGSPVYDDATGALIGSVSYGFTSALSPRAGVTPATYIYDLTAPGYSASAQAPATVKASRAEAAAIARASSNPAPLGTGHVLEPAKQVSGVNAALANTFAKKSPLLQKKSPALAGGFRAGAGGGGSDVDYPIVPGGSIALTASTGTITTGMVGTVTAVCGAQVFAFGHPANFTGTSTMTFNGAQTVTIQEDGIFSPSFKIANIGRVKGVINQDRVQGVVGTLGQAPSAATVTTSATAPRLAAPRVSSTSVSEQEALPYVVASQIGSDAISALNQYAAGDALMSWTITYTRSGSAGVKTFKRTQRYSTSQGFPELVAFDAASDVEALLTNGFEKVRISSVAVSSSLQPTYRAVKPSRAQYYSKGTWHWVGRNGIKAKRGSTVPVRLRVVAADADSVARPAFTSQTKVKISKNARGTGKLVFEGQASSGYSEDDEFADDDLLALLLAEETGEDDEEYEGPSNLNELLDLLSSQQRQDNAVGTLTYKTKRGKVESERTVRGPSVVKGTLKVRLTFKK
ncbi:MAG: hypothetical protein JWR55_2306 [Aeromicrobium sp.]|nr:hypothetical protein [Aeromicrobium sp.]